MVGYDKLLFLGRYCSSNFCIGFFCIMFCNAKSFSCFETTFLIFNFDIFMEISLLNQINNFHQQIEILLHSCNRN